MVIALTGLIGQGISYSRSPRLHEAEGAAQGLVISYRLIDADGDKYDAAYLSTLLVAARHLGYRGLNVTQPFKANIFELADTVDATSEALGAVNTLVLDESGTHGFNTDAPGFGLGLDRQLPGIDLSDIVVFGAGGAGAAVAHAVLARGCLNLSLIDPTHGQARKLAERLRLRFPGSKILAIDPEELSDRLDAATGIINASPIGSPASPGSPLDVSLIRGKLWVADVIYAVETPLLKAARAKGCRVIDGSAMLVYQAAQSFEIFHGVAADHERMFRTFSQMARR